MSGQLHNSLLFSQNRQAKSVPKLPRNSYFFPPPEPLFSGGAPELHAEHGGCRLREGLRVPDLHGTYRAADLLGYSTLFREDPRSGTAADPRVQSAMPVLVLSSAEATHSGIKKSSYCLPININARPSLPSAVMSRRVSRALGNGSSE